MRLAVIAPGYWATEELARQRCWLYLRSCEKFGVEPMFYGIGAKSYPGLATMRIYGQVECLDSLIGFYSHVLFSDAWDVMFTQPLNIIKAMYESMGSPPFLMGGSGQDHDWLDMHVPESYAYAQLDCFKTRGFYRFPSTTFWMGEVEYIRDQLDRVTRGAHGESHVIGEAFRLGYLTPTIDVDCLIFQEKALFLEVNEGHLFNRATGTYPGVAHFSHGHTDPVTGKDALMIPWARKLGIL